MLVDLINQYDYTNIGNANTTSGTDVMGKDQFLQLLVTQLKNQDPLDPIKNEEFVAQLAQFNSLEQMINLNKSFESMLSLQQMSYASTFIGRDVAWINADGAEQSGAVQEVQLIDGAPMLVVGDETGGVLVSPDDVIAVGKES